MNYCKRCLYPENHPLGIIFDDDGICSGCRVHEEKYVIDWEKKDNELEVLLNHYKNSNSFYDCIIPVSGTGDDFFVVETIKNKYGMNPLLVTYNTHFNTKIGVRNLSRLITELDCDHMYSTVGPESVREITRITLKDIGDIYWHILAGSQTFPVHVATKLKVPLIIWGVNGWLDQVGMFSHDDNVEMTKKVRKEHALRKIDAESLIGLSDKISNKDLQAFTYPSDAQLETSRVRGIYLGNYVFWDSQKQIDDVIKKYGYETCLQERTFNNYESIACWNNASIHDYIKFLKYGYGKVSDHASRDIRLKRMTREEGINLVKVYQDIEPKNLHNFLDWLDITEDYFYSCINKFRDPNIWEKNQSGDWVLIDSIINHVSDEGVNRARLEITEKRDYQLTALMENNEDDDEYILLGRSYLDETNYKAIQG